MHYSSTILALIGAVGVSARQCRDITIPISISSRNNVLDLKPLTTEIEVTNFYLNLAKQGSNHGAQLTTGQHDVEGDYKLAVTYCEPDSGPGDVLQIMTHGIGFDRSYWDLPAQDYKYSYVSRAVDDYGYSTLTWDRLGVGASSHGETINEIQIFLEIAALKELTLQFAGGHACGVKHKYDKIVHLGHSFGSAMTYSLVRENPDISAGIILTGFSQVPDYMGLFALGGNFVPVSSLPALAIEYPEGYVAAGTRMGVHNNFFAPGDFDEEILDYLWTHGQPNTPGEILTVGAGAAELNNFPGPAMVITGERDVPFCGGDCMATSAIRDSAPDLIANSKQFFPSSSAFNSTVVAAAGHGLFLGYSAFSAFDAIFEFLDHNL